MEAGQKDHCYKNLSLCQLKGFCTEFTFICLHFNISSTFLFGFRCQSNGHTSFTNCSSSISFLLVPFELNQDNLCKLFQPASYYHLLLFFPTCKLFLSMPQMCYIMCMLLQAPQERPRKEGQGCCESYESGQKIYKSVKIQSSVSGWLGNDPSQSHTKTQPRFILRNWFVGQ